MMKVDFVEQFVMDPKNPWYGKARNVRVEYGGHAENCVSTGSLWLPWDITHEECETILNILRRVSYSKDENEEG